MLNSYPTLFTDVFDTILLRKPVSERNRQYRIAKNFVAAGFMPHQDDEAVNAVYWARRKAQSLAFRALMVGGDTAEVKLSSILFKQVKLLGLGPEAQEQLLKIELEIEKSCLYPNLKLIKQLKTFSENGGMVFAISDTTLDADSVSVLLKHFFSTEWITQLYSSADEQKTKRSGELFNHILTLNGLLASDVSHIGDNKISDGRRARASGLNTQIMPRSKFHILRTKLDGVKFEIGRMLEETKPIDKVDNQQMFGREVMGPIIVSFSLQLWLYLSATKDHQLPVALFCARGGLIMRQAYELVLKQMKLGEISENEDFMISRFIIAKAGLYLGDDSVLREIEREYAGKTLNEVIFSFSDVDLEIAKKWYQPYSIESMKAYLANDESQAFRDSLKVQYDFLLSHFNNLVGNSNRAVLIDTGLFGSIQLFLQNILPETSIESVLFARCNYKNFNTDHFKSITGLLTEKDDYDPLDSKTAILRYWQLIEEIFEPDLQSVKCFQEGIKAPISNLEQDGWEDCVQNHSHPIYKGIMDYILELTPQSLGKIVTDEKAAWAKYKRIIIFPTKKEAKFLTVGQRDRDFGLTGYASDTSENSKSALGRFKSALWKNAAVYEAFSLFAIPIHLLIELGYFVRRAQRLPASLRRWSNF